MDRLTRKELKTDKFAAEVGQTVAFLEKHRREATIGGIAMAVVAVIAVGVYFHMSSQRAERQRLLFAALQDYDATVGAGTPYTKSFPTEEDKRKAVDQSFHVLTDQYGQQR